MRSRAGELQTRHDATFSWKTAINAVHNLPGLRGAWTMGSFDQAGDQYDLSGQGRTLGYNGNPTYSNAGLIPFLLLDGVGDFLDRADEAALDITGTETYIAGSRRGLTMGIWVYPTVVSAQQDIIGKWNTAGAVNQRSYMIRLLNTNVFQAMITLNGAAATLVTVNSTVAVSASQWYFVEMAYSPTARSNLLTINVNGTIDSVAAATASLHSGTANLVIGASDNGAANLLTGRVSLAWLCAMYHQSYQMQAVYQHTRALYGR